MRPAAAIQPQQRVSEFKASVLHGARHSMVGAGAAESDGVASAGKHLAEATARRDHDLGRFNSVSALTREKRKLLWRERFLVVAEAVAICLAVASFLGLTDDNGAPASFSAWLSGASLSASAVLAGWGLAWVGARMFPSGPLPKRIGVWAALGLGAASIAFAVSIGFLRYAGTDGHASVGAETAGSVGLAIIVSLCSAVVFTTCLITRRQLLVVEAELAEVGKRDDAHGRTIDRLSSAKNEAETRHAAMQQESRSADILETAFESAVQLIAEKLRAYNAILPDRTARAVSTWRSLKDLSAPERELVATTAFRLVPADSATSRTNPGGTAALVSRTLTLLLLTFAAIGTSACTDTRTPEAVTVICDPSGASPESVCTSAFLSSAFRSFAVASPRLGSRFEVIFPNDALGSAIAADPIIVAPRSRAERQAWIDRTVTALGSETLPNIGADETDNVSDLIGAALVASASGRAYPTHHHVLVLASDGLIVSGELGINCEKRVPTAKDVLVKLKAKHVTLDLSPFSGGITICGFSNQGLTGTALQAREALWRQLIAASHGPTPVILPTCKGLLSEASTPNHTP